MDSAKLEITANEEVIFGLYPDGNMLVKNDPSCLAIAQERLTAGLECLSTYGEPLPRDGSRV
jgi:hypothetical protein